MVAEFGKFDYYLHIAYETVERIERLKKRKRELKAQEKAQRMKKKIGLQRLRKIKGD